MVSWDPAIVSSHPVCGQVKYNVTISPSDEIMMRNISDTFYTIAKSPYNFTTLTNSLNLTISVFGTNLGGSGEAVTMEVITPGLSQAVPSSKCIILQACKFSTRVVDR